MQNKTILMEIRETCLERLSQVRQIWKERFTEDEAYLDIVFSRIMPRCRTFCLIEHDNVRSIASFMPMDFISGDMRSSGWYMFGVATEKTSEGRKYASQVISAATGKFKTEGSDFVFERPAYQELNPFYIKLGFTRALPRIPYRFPAILPGKDVSGADARQIAGHIAALFSKRFEWSDMDILQGLILLGEISANNDSLPALDASLETYIAIYDFKGRPENWYQGTFFCFPME